MVSIDEYLNAVKKSKLLSEKQFIDVLKQVKSGSKGKKVTVEFVANTFLESGKITEWQNQKLTKGRYRGFFLGNYKLLNHIAAGGMSNIYLAEHRQMRRRVAVKVLPPSLTENASYLERFYVESRAIAALDHPNIVRAYDISRDGKYHFMALEYVDGSDLRRLVESDTALEPILAVDYIRQAARGLQHAHERNLIHRDIKPANLLVDKNGVIKVLDMGLSRIDQTDEASLTLQHKEKVIGTVDYLAPEQSINSHDVDIRCDIYSLGGTLYFLLAGHPPFPEGNQMARMIKHRNEEPKSLLEIREDLDPDLNDIICKMMAKSPDNRYQSASELEDALSEWLAKQHPSQIKDVRMASSEISDSDFASDLGNDYLMVPSEMGSELSNFTVDRHQDYVQRMNARLTNSQVEKYSEEIRVRAEECNEAQEKLTQLESFLEQKAQELEEQVQQLDTARARMNQLEKYLDKKSKDLESQGEELDKKSELLKLKENAIDSRESKLEIRERAYQESCEELERRWSVLETREQELAAKKEDIARLEKEYASTEKLSDSDPEIITPSDPTPESERLDSGSDPLFEYAGGGVLDDPDEIPASAEPGKSGVFSVASAPEVTSSDTADPDFFLDNMDVEAVDFTEQESDFDLDFDPSNQIGDEQGINSLFNVKEKNDNDSLEITISNLPPLSQIEDAKNKAQSSQPQNTPKQNPDN